MPAVVYEEIECKSALRRVVGSTWPEPLWALDPYREPRQAPLHCGPSRRHDCLGHHADPVSGRRVIVKTNVVEVLRRELSRSDWGREAVAIGAASDPYQRAELRYGLTRGVLRALRDHASPCCVVTRSPLVMRDLPVLQELCTVTRAAVVVTIPTLDDGVLHHIEPHDAGHRQRLETIARLADGGVACGAAITPAIPGLTDDVENAEAVEQAAREHGAGFVAYDALQVGPALRRRSRPVGPGSGESRLLAPRRGPPRDAAGQLELAI